MRRRLKTLDKHLNDHPRLTFWLTLAACAILVVSRRPAALFHAQFWAEGGKVWYAQAYNTGPLVTLFHTYAGTFSLLTRIAGSLSLLVPLMFVPLFLNIFALLCQLLPLVMINSSRLKHLMPYRFLAIAVSLLYVGIPNSDEVFIDLANIQWHLAIVAFLVLIAGNGQSKKWQVFDIGVLLATGLTGPLGLVLLPVAAIIWWSKRTADNMYKLLALIITAIPQLFSLFVINAGSRVNAQPYASGLKFLKMLTGQIITGGVLGEKHVGMFYNHPLTMIIILIILIYVIAYVAIKGPAWLKLANLYAGLIIALMLVSLKPYKGFDVWNALTYPGGGQRYWYIPIFVWLVTLFWLALRGNKALKLLGVIGMLLFLSVGMPQNWKLDSYSDFHFSAYVKEFNSLKPGQSLKIPINPEGWHMLLHKK